MPTVQNAQRPRRNHHLSTHEVQVDNSSRLPAGRYSSSMAFGRFLLGSLIILYFLLNFFQPY